MQCSCPPHPRGRYAVHRPARDLRGPRRAGGGTVLPREKSRQDCAAPGAARAAKVASTVLPREKSRSRARREFVAPGETWETSVRCNVKKNARPGKYSLMITAKATNAQRVDQTAQFEVRDVGGG